MRHQRDEIKAKSLSWLSAVDFSQAYAQRCQEHLPGTGSWLLQSDSYLAWKTSGVSNLLWIKGKPGCGKSVLAAFVIHHLRLEADSGSACAYAFCRRDNESLQNPLDILCALTKQISEQTTDLDPALKSAFNAAQRSSRPGLSTIYSILKAAISHFSRAYLVIDALDECNDNHVLAGEILRLVRERTDCEVKVVILSRPDYGLEQVLSSYRLLKLVQPDTGNNSQDLELFIQTCFTDASQATTSRKIIQECISKADGMFLWVKLLKDDFRTTPMTLRQQLESVQETPAGLQEIYERMIDNVRNQRKAARLTASHVLMLVTHTYRPLSEYEMLNAVANYEGVTTIEDAADSRHVNAEHLIIICKHLVSIDRDRCFRLCHESAREVVLDYLRELGHEDHQTYTGSDVTSTHVNSYIAETCLTYLLLHNFATGPARSIGRLRALDKKFPFMMYAAGFWGMHLPHYIPTRLQALVHKFLRSKSRCELSIQIILLDSYSPGNFWYFPGSSNMLHTLSLFGLTKIAVDLPDSVALSSQADGSGTTPLIYAVMHKHHEMSMWLLDKLLNESENALTIQQKAIILRQAALLDWSDVLRALLDREKRPAIHEIDQIGTLVAKACSMANIGAAKCLIDYGADVDRRDANGLTPLALASFNRQLPIMKLLLEQGANVECTDPDGRTPLQITAMMGSTDAVAMLISGGANVEATAVVDDSYTPLHHATMRSSLAVIEILCKAGANVHAKSSRKHTALHMAAWFKHSACAELLLRLGSLKDEVDREHRTALFMAIEQGNLDTIQVLIDGGCSITFRDRHGRNIVHAAVRSGKPEVLQYILRQHPAERRRALVNHQDKNGQTPLHEAVLADNLKMVKLLLELRARGEMIDIYGTCVLHNAARWGREAMSFTLLESTKDPNPRDGSGRTPLHVASEYGQCAFIRQFIQDCSRLDLTIQFNARNLSNDTALMLALAYGFESVATLLLEKDHTLSHHSCDTARHFPVHLAAWHGFDSIIEKLLDHEGITCSGHGGSTPLYYAAKRGNLSSVKLLLNKANEVLNTADDTGTTPVLAALRGGHVEVASFLLDCKANHMSVDQNGSGAIHWAAYRGFPTMVKRLLELGCDASAPNRLGDTPCHLAVSANNIEVIGILVAAGFNAINYPNLLGHTCIHLAAEDGHTEILEKLRLHGAELDYQDLNGCSAATFAASNGHRSALQYLAKHGASLTLTDFNNATPLIRAAAHGFPDAVRYILDNDHSNINACTMARESALTLATISGFPLTIRALLAAGADPYHRDSGGMNALDYAARHAPSLREFQRAGIFHCADNPHERRSIIDETIRECCRALLGFSDKNLDEIKSRQRQIRLQVLANALLRKADYEPAEICLQDRIWSYRFRTVHESYICDVCENENFAGCVYICRECPLTTIGGRVDLCQDCHRDYLKAGRRAPNALLEIKQLEDRVHAIRAAIPDQLSLLNVTDIMEYFEIGVQWLSRTTKAFQDWAAKYNFNSKYQHFTSPEWKFIKLISRARTLLARVNQGETLSQPDVEELVKMGADYTAIKTRYRTDRELYPFLCQGHGFCEVSLNQQKRSKNKEQDFDPETGRVTNKFLENLIVQHDPSADVRSAGLSTTPGTDTDDSRSKPATSDQVASTELSFGNAALSDAFDIAPSSASEHGSPDALSMCRPKSELLFVRNGLRALSHIRPIDIGFTRNRVVPVQTIKIDVKKTGVLTTVQTKLNKSTSDLRSYLAKPLPPRTSAKRRINLVVEDGYAAETENDISSSVTCEQSPLLQHQRLEASVPLGAGSRERHSASTNSISDNMQRPEDSQEDASVARLYGSSNETKRVVRISCDDEDEDMQTWFQALLVAERMKPGFVQAYLDKYLQKQEEEDALAEDSKDTQSAHQSDDASEGLSDDSDSGTE